MKTDPIWPARAAEFILWAQLVFTWVVASYALVPAGDTDRSRAPGRHVRLVIAGSFAAVAAALLPPPGSDLRSRCLLGALLLLFVVLTALGRRWLARSPRFGAYLVESEIAANLLCVLVTGLAIGMARIGALPAGSVLRSGRCAAAACIVAGVVFVFRGGTNIVRGVLDKVQVAPRIKAEGTAGDVQAGIQPGDTPPAVDEPELNRGRSIGNLERLLMIMVIGLGSYEALGFLIAAKGLIRAREFEDRNFAEYFILGSLASAAVALAVGIALRVSLPFLWKLP
jgi:hypothetical protein